MFLLQIGEKEKGKLSGTEKRKADDGDTNKDLKKVRVSLLNIFILFVFFIKYNVKRMKKIKLDFEV